MSNVAIIGIDLAKRVFHAHGALADGSVAFRRRLSRSQVLPFLASQSPCVVAMEACASAHEWGRAIIDLGHEVRLIPPACVKPYVKRHKNDTADAEAIAEAGLRPTMRFVAVKSREQQARSMVFRTRDLLVRQRTQLINALRGHLAEHGIIAPQGPAHLQSLAVNSMMMAVRCRIWCSTLAMSIWNRLQFWMLKLRNLKKFFVVKHNAEPRPAVYRQCPESDR